MEGVRVADYLHDEAGDGELLGRSGVFEVALDQVSSPQSSEKLDYD